jgi:hypothetical protein
LIKDVINRTKKVTGIIIPSEQVDLDDLSYIYKRNIRVLLLPENINFNYSDKSSSSFLNFAAIILNSSFMNLVAIPSINEDKCLRYYYHTNWFRMSDNNFKQYFDHYKNIKKIVIPKNTKTLPTSSFENHAELEEVIFHDGLVEIGYKAFKNCFSLKKIAFYDAEGNIHDGFPQSLKSIGAVAFKNTGIQEINFETECFFAEGCFSYCKDLKSVRFNVFRMQQFRFRVFCRKCFFD